MGLPSANRLKRRQDFQAIYQQGIRYSSPHLVLRVLPVLGEIGTNKLKSPKIGLSVSQKVSKQAVTRNHIKRQIRAAMRSLLPHLSPDWWLVIAVRPSAAECKYEHFLRELKQLLIQAKIYGHSRNHIL